MESNAECPATASETTDSGIVTLRSDGELSTCLSDFDSFLEETCAAAAATAC